MNKRKPIWRNAAEGYFAAFALANIGHIATTNIITLVLFSCAFSCFFLPIKKKPGMRCPQTAKKGECHFLP